MSRSRFNQHYLEFLQADYENAREAGTIGYFSNTLAQLAIPHRKTDVHQFVRHDGRVTIRITDVFNHGLPYGVIPRLILCWIATEAFNRKDRTLCIDGSLSKFMRNVGVIPAGCPDGRTIKSFKHQLVKTLSAAITCEENTQKSIHGQLVTVSKEFKFFWQLDLEVLTNIKESFIVLDEDYYESCIYRPVVVDFRALRALKRSPLALDIYVWGTYRMATCKKTTNTIPWSYLQNHFGCGYSNNENGRKNFKKMFLRYLGLVISIFPNFKVKQVNGGIKLLPGAPHVPKLCG